MAPGCSRARAEAAVFEVDAQLFEASEPMEGLRELQAGREASAGPRVVRV